MMTDPNHHKKHRRPQYPRVDSIHWKHHTFHPVVHLPKDYEVRDFTQGNGEHQRPSTSTYDIGRYNEVRPGMYTTDLFQSKKNTTEQPRNIHVGIDIGAPVGTACMAFADSTIAQYGYNAAPGDYGNVVILKTMLQCYDEEEDDGTTTTMVPVWALYGHLTHESLHGKYRGQPIRKGDTIGWMGNTHENGGWPCHLHFQLSFDEPTTHDLPGVVSADDHATALQKYPDPRLVLGPIYQD